ncbi:hypothetical protein GGI25_004556 [Coemansia spiralis]|uniref:Uncharacterized protein n=2 Tax=Coemansia TaxID=4863 RepID=A0A9W8KVG4_9FUNG|nr:hypothetical protein BX070DRAFT_264309 [Coemansia spiralis]KAJ1989940.1 hypothetical protein EDC05_004374 [Coemansia umbellata]KAJ2620654.1 hypothetical protein GGI26_004816 [Coemansia sp. RSA 1358]KAJ2673809.1 hypothetical protein GGI25_004556 [Coemansia spiralis]
MDPQRPPPFPPLDDQLYHTPGALGSYSDSTPPTQVAAMAVGRRLELAPPRFQLQPSAFPTPTTANPPGHEMSDQPVNTTPMDIQSKKQVDQDFILSLHQEGDLETLSRKAVKDARGAWKQLTMDSLKKQVASLEQDEWMYN